HRLAAPVLAVAWLYAANVSVFEPFARARSARGATATRIVLTAADALIALAWCEATGAIDSPWVVALYVAALSIPLRFGFRAAIVGGVLYALAYFGVCAAQRLLTQHLAAVIVQTTHLAAISVMGSILAHAVQERQQAVMNHVKLVTHDLRSPLAA